MTRRKEKRQEPRKKQNHKKTMFKFLAPEAQSVQLAGDFNAWIPEAHPLKKTSNGVWKVNLNLSPGRYEYRFLVDGQWHNATDCESYVPNPYGGDNCVITLK